MAIAAFVLALIAPGLSVYNLVRKKSKNCAQKDRGRIANTISSKISKLSRFMVLKVIDKS
ncbi:MAG: hypothetical protein U9O41_02110 [Candidatus Aerophobetes bacterium]|nr:hypothetical protein [Candidatus Aerophobetes bacterium]